MQSDNDSKHITFFKICVHIFVIVISIIIAYLITTRIQNILNEMDFDSNTVLLITIVILLAIYFGLLYIFYLIAVKTGLIKKRESLNLENTEFFSNQEMNRIKNIMTDLPAKKSMLHYDTPKFKKLVQQKKFLSVFLFFLPILWFLSLSSIQIIFEIPLTVEELLIVSLVTITVLIFLNFFVSNRNFSETIGLDKYEVIFSKFSSFILLIPMLMDLLLIFFLLLFIGYDSAFFLMVFFLTGLFGLYYYYFYKIRRILNTVNEKSPDRRIFIYPARYPIFMSFQIEVFSILIFSTELLEQIKSHENEEIQFKTLEFLYNIMLISPIKRMVFSITRMLLPIFIALLLWIVISPYEFIDFLFLAIVIGFIALYFCNFINGYWFREFYFKEFKKNIDIYLSNWEKSPDFQVDQIVSLFHNCEKIFAFLSRYQFEKSASLLSFNLFGPFFNVITFADFETTIISLRRE
ncbi:MAG: hypothetical protein HeimC3_22500 [Candidatus Heimdallarchaeota archaeon LC_3]|nr:MAG: hypothetical protein HeimC3_22500 [Candidatus Heimdallarchaeota archaeon LC_3]